MADVASRVQAVCRARTGEIRLIRGDGATFDIPADEAAELAEAINRAIAVPTLAEALQRETAWSAR
jgi:hypothetical protein